MKAEQLLNTVPLDDGGGIGGNGGGVGGVGNGGVGGGDGGGVCALGE